MGEKAPRVTEENKVPLVTKVWLVIWVKLAVRVNRDSQVPRDLQASPDLLEDLALKATWVHWVCQAIWANVALLARKVPRVIKAQKVLKVFPVNKENKDPEERQAVWDKSVSWVLLDVKAIQVLPAKWAPRVRMVFKVWSERTVSLVSQVNLAQLVFKAALDLREKSVIKDPRVRWEKEASMAQKVHAVLLERKEILDLLVPKDLLEIQVRLVVPVLKVIREHVVMLAHEVQLVRRVNRVTKVFAVMLDYLVMLEHWDPKVQKAPWVSPVQKVPEVQRAQWDPEDLKETLGLLRSSI